MHLLINKRKIYFYLFSLFILTTIINQNLTNFFREYFLIKQIEIKVSSSEIKKNIQINTNYLNNKNIIFLDKKNIFEALSDLNYLENISVKKKLPSKIKINADKTNFLATTYINKEKYYVGENGKFITAKKLLNEEKLPIIFGKFQINDFINLKKILNQENINQENIIKYYYHKNKRWDLYYKENILIKLPNDNISSSIKLYKKFKIKNDIKTGAIIDLRIKNRIVLNNG